MKACHPQSVTLYHSCESISFVLSLRVSIISFPESSNSHQNRFTYLEKYLKKSLMLQPHCYLILMLKLRFHAIVHGHPIS